MAIQFTKTLPYYPSIRCSLYSNVYKVCFYGIFIFNLEQDVKTDTVYINFLG